MLVSCVCVCDWFDDLMILLKKKNPTSKCRYWESFVFNIDLTMLN